MIKEKRVTPWWIWALGTFIILYIFSSLFVSVPESTPQERVEEIITNKGFEYISSSYYNLENIMSTAYIKFKHYKGDEGTWLLQGLQTLYRVYPNATYYVVDIEIKRKGTCKFSIDGNEYRYYYVTNYSDEIYSDGFIWLREHKENGDCR